VAAPGASPREGVAPNVKLQQKTKEEGRSEVVAKSCSLVRVGGGTVFIRI